MVILSIYIQLENGFVMLELMVLVAITVPVSLIAIIEISRERSK